MNEKQFNEILLKLPNRISRAIAFLSDDIKSRICEIRIISDHPVKLMLADRLTFLSENGGIYDEPNDSLTATADEVNECFLSLCNRSVFTHYNEIKEGFLAVEYGCRAGICGKFLDGKTVSVTSINLRIPHSVENCSKALLPYALEGLLIAGPPASGKTTVLRDIIKKLSNGESGRYKKVCVIDSREEITSGFDMGPCTDVLFIGDKSKGVEMAIRTMSPDVVAFDEIGSVLELKSVTDSFNAGVSVITTVHAGSIEELSKRTVTSKLLRCGAIKNVALLCGEIGAEPTLHKAEDILNEYY